MRLVGIDTETFLIRPGHIVPKLVCVSFAERDPVHGAVVSSLLSHVDADLKPRLMALLQPGNGVRIVFHNGSFDLCVIAKEYPDLESMIWDKLEAGECSDTMHREQLLNLSSRGKLDMLHLPDGSSKRVVYNLAALVLDYVGVDISDSKDDDDSPRLRYGELEGLSASQYSPSDADYARKDAEYLISIFEGQEKRIRTEDGYASLSTESFQLMTSFALLWITETGMAVDKERFRKIEAKLKAQLTDQKMDPLYRAGLLTRPEPWRPYVKQDARARQLLSDWTGVAEEDVDWSKVDDGMREALQDAGIKFKMPEDSSVDTKVLKHRVLALTIATQTADPVDSLLKQPVEVLHALAEQQEVKFAATPTGEVATKAEVLDLVADADVPLPGDEKSPMVVYQERQALQKMVTTELPGMCWNGEPADVVHFPFRTIVETSRTSSFMSKKYPSRNGQNVDPQTRPAFVARPGYLLCSTDFATLELVTTGQTTYDLFGKSVHRDKINAGYDLHAYLGCAIARMYDAKFRDEVAGLSLDDAYRIFMAKGPVVKGGLGTDEKFWKHWRKLAKPIGLGFPGGLGPHKLVLIARKDPYFVDMVALACERFETNPEEFDLADRSVRFYAQKLHKMGKNDVRWTPMLKAVAYAKRLRDVWLATYPEMVSYFEWVKEQKDLYNPVLTMAGDDGEEDREVEGLCYTTPMGMHRAGATFTSVANGKCMQSPAAEGLKVACIRLVRTCRTVKGSILHGTAKVVDEVHDETITELLSTDGLAHERAMEIKRIMEESMRMIITDVKVKAEPCLMERWWKLAEPVYGDDGRLQVWRPKEAA